MDIVIQLLSEFGFPIVVALLCAWFIYKMFILFHNDGKEREIRDRETITHLSEIVSTNSKALLKNSESMERIADKLENVDSRICDIEKDVQEIKIKVNNK